MGGKLATDPPEHRLAILAARQHGVVSRGQFLALGLGTDAIEKRARAGRLHRVHRGVYAVGHPRLTQHGRFLAAVLACGEGTLLSHASAARLWGLQWSNATRVHVSVPGRGGRQTPAAIMVHRMSLQPGDAAIKDGIPVTSPGRTVIDLADSRQRRPVERALDEAAYLRLDLTGLTPRQGRCGSGLLAMVLAEHNPGSTFTRSHLEELFLALCDRHGLPRPLVNSRAGYEVDFVWPGQRLIVETDGHAAHGSRTAFDRDRIRDADLVTAGWRVVRLTYGRIASQPAAIAEQLRTLLG